LGFLFETQKFKLILTAFFCTVSALISIRRQQFNLNGIMIRIHVYHAPRRNAL
jgi:hypothetical protein